MSRVSLSVRNILVKAENVVDPIKIALSSILIIMQNIITVCAHTRSRVDLSYDFLLVSHSN